MNAQRRTPRGPRLRASLDGLARRVARPAALIPLLALAALPGCAVDQKKEVATYRKVLDEGAPPTRELNPGDTLTLEQAFALSNQHNEQLGLRGEDYLQALIDKNRAVANFLPTVSFQPNYIIGQTPGSNLVASTVTTGGNGGSSSALPADSSGASYTSAVGPSGAYKLNGNKTFSRLEAPVVGNINLFHGGADLAQLRASDAAINQFRGLLLDAQATVLVNVAQTYYQVLRSEKQVDVLRHSLDLQEARVRDLEARLANGLALRLEVAQARAQAAATRSTLEQALSDVRNGRSTLAFLIGAPAVDGPLVDELPVPPALGDEKQFEREASGGGRQDLAAAQQAVIAARFSVQVNVAQYYPSVSLNLEGFLYREAFAASSKWDALLQANLPIFSAGRIQADVRTAWSRLRQAGLSESYLRRQIMRDIQVSFENVATAEQKLKDLQTQVDAAQEALDQATLRFNQQLAIYLDVFTAQDVLLNAQLQLASEAYDRTVFYLDLLRAAGRLSTRLPGEARREAATLPTSRTAGTVSNAATGPTTGPSTRPLGRPASVPAPPAIVPPFVPPG